MGLAYYNEFDPKMASWLRKLISSGHLPGGVVDERDIRNVKAWELSGFSEVHFFAGIGGWPLALELSGFGSGFWHADSPVWTGSCPCQNFSNANSTGKEKGFGGERDLWPEFQRLIMEAKPRPQLIFGEQVASSLGHVWLSRVSNDLHDLQYRFGAASLPAASVGAPHKRSRLFWVADSDRQQLRAKYGSMGIKEEEELRERVQRQWSGDDSRYSSKESGRVADSQSTGFKTWQPDSLGTEYQTSGNQRFFEVQSESSGRVADSANGGFLGSIEHDRKHAQERRSEWDPSHNDWFTSQRGQAGGRLADSGNEGLQGRIPGGEDSQWKIIDRQFGSSGSIDFWEPSKLVDCIDGKQRRIPIEPSFRPLADGFSSSLDINKTTALRGFGNAIVPQVAAQFIQAFMDIKNEA